MQIVYTLRDALESTCRAHAGKTAIVDGPLRVSYKQLLKRIHEFAGVLQNRGVTKGSRVGIFLPRSADSVVAIFATWYCGGVGVFINDILKFRQVHHIVESSEPTVIVTSAKLKPVLDESSGKSIEILLSEDLPSQVPSVTVVPVISSDLALIVYTSGSTGLPKGIMLSHDNLMSGAQIVSDYLRLTCNDVVISLLPFSFDYGLNQLLTSLLVGATCVIERSVFPADICVTLQQERVTGMAAVPMLWQQLAHPRSPFLKTTLPHLRYLTNTGGRMPEPITRSIRKIHPKVQVFLMFGLTEAFRSTVLLPDQVDIRPTSIGKAIPNVEILVLDPEGRPCRPGEVGELVHRGANISLGYWKDPQTTARVFRRNPLSQATGGRDEIVVFSGDYVKTDDEGFIYYIGRKDGLLKSHGMRVSPEEIEASLLDSGLIMHAVVFGVERPEEEPLLVAAVVPVEKDRFQVSDLAKFAQQEMPEYLRPHEFWPCETFPQTSSGKPDRVRLREMYQEFRSRTS